MFVQTSTSKSRKAANKDKPNLKRVSIHAFVDSKKKAKSINNKTADFADQALNSSPEQQQKTPSLGYGRILLWVFVIGLMGIIYLAHVGKTNTLLEQRNQVRIEHQNAEYKLQEMQRNYERVISPSNIYEKASQEGYKSAQVNDPVLIIK